jgi:hypothetical protein
MGRVVTAFLLKRRQDAKAMAQHKDLNILEAEPSAGIVSLFR